MRNLVNRQQTSHFLVAHGSREPSFSVHFHQLAELVTQFLVKNHGGEVHFSPLLTIGTLEWGKLPLAQQIVNFAHRAKNQGYQGLDLFPLFLSAGVHVTEDIPQELIKAQEDINYCDFTVNLLPYLGSYPQIVDILAQKFQIFTSEGRILFAHGSAKGGANGAIESLAKELGALNAYWSIKPSLGEQIENLINQGLQSITIVPYLLFHGGLMEVILEQINQFRAVAPQVKIFLDTPLGASAALAQLIASQLQSVQGNY